MEETSECRKKASLPPQTGKWPCPVCWEEATRFFASLRGRDYYRCLGCGATFLRPDQRPSPESEQARYRQHHNDSDDAGYRRFLARLADPLLARLPPHQNGLDFGCGPGPVLADMLRAAGHRVSLYDPVFTPDSDALAGHYDFITVTEVVEHFHHPREEFNHLNSLLRPGGIIGIMTCFQTDDARFENWHYVRDPTHVVFYREETLLRVARERNWEIAFLEKDVLIVKKK